jgi:hypothetical protein
MDTHDLTTGQQRSPRAGEQKRTAGPLVDPIHKARTGVEYFQGSVG